MWPPAGGEEEKRNRYILFHISFFLMLIIFLQLFIISIPVVLLLSCISCLQEMPLSPLFMYHVTE